MSVKGLLLFFLMPSVFPIALKLFLIFLLITISGIILFNSIFKLRNKLLLMGGGMILGTLGYLFLLSVFSYFIKGPLGILILFITFVASPITYEIFTRKVLNIFNKWSISVSAIILATIVSLYIIFLFLFIGNALVGGDVVTYWAIASSFARGNYPTMLPWQPDMLTVYHEGVFVIEGAIHSLSGVGMSSLHFFFSFYIITALFLFITGIARERTRSLLSLIPGVLGLIIFVIPVIPITHVLSFFSLFKDGFKASLALLASSPQAGQLKPAAGNGALGLGDIVYSNFHALGVACLFLLAYTAFYLKSKNFFIKAVFLIILLILLLSVEETLFLPAAGILILWYLANLTQNHTKEKIFFLFPLIFLFTALFFIIQNPIRDSLLIPAKEAPRFKVIPINSSLFAEREEYMGDRTFVDPKTNITWYIPSIITMISVVGFLSIILNSSWSLTFVFMSVTSMIGGLFLVNTFWPANGLRFFSSAYNILTFGFGFLLVDIFVQKKRYLLLLGFLSVLILLPQMVTAHAFLLSNAFTKGYDNYTRNFQYSDPVLDWMNQHLGYSSRILLVDDYPTSSSQLMFPAVSLYGFFLPAANPNIKVLNFDQAGNWFDATTYLSPSAMKKLKIDYIYLKTPLPLRFTPDEISRLTNNGYISSVVSFPEGTVYKVSSSFFQLQENRETLATLIAKIKHGKSVYIGKLAPSLPEIRKEFFLSLSKKNHIYGPFYSAAYDYPMYIETFVVMNILPPKVATDYVVLAPGVEPTSLMNGEYVKIAGNEYAILWQKREN